MIDFDSFSAANLIRTDDLRAALVAAVQAARAGKLDLANLYLTAAYEVFSVAIRQWGRRARGMDEREEMFAGVWIREIVTPNHSLANRQQLLTFSEASTCSLVAYSNEG